MAFEIPDQLAWLTDLDASIAFVQGKAPFASREEIETLLVLSAGTNEDGTVTIYRPYAVLAELFTSKWDQYKRLRGASGAELEFNSAVEAGMAMRGTQRKIDQSLPIYNIPPAWRSNQTTVAANW